MQKNFTILIYNFESMINLENFNKLEILLKEESVIWKSIPLIKEIKNWKIIYTREKCKVNEIEFSFWDRVQIWISRNGMCTNVDLTILLIILLDKNMVNNRIGIASYLTKYTVESIKGNTKINADILKIVSAICWKILDQNK